MPGSRPSAPGDAVRALTLAARLGASLATAESLTGGRVAAGLTAVPGASAVYVGGVVAYTPEVKRDVLGVPQSLIDAHGVVSAECARAMAQGACAVTGARYAVSTTGVAGPDPAEGKPVGTVFLGIAGPRGVRTVALELAGDRAQIQDRTVLEALAALVETLELAGLSAEETTTG